MQAVVGTGRLVAGRYRLTGPLGRGAMGIVWRGRDELLDRDVAVKEVQITALATPTDAEIIYQRTLREARTAARLSHPSVVTVFDVVEENGSPWIVMELVRARSLDQVITEDGPLPPLEASQVGESLLGALATAHAAGVLHRDVKPSNVLITGDGRAVLTDFGIATFEGDPGLTQVGMVVGTPGFTAPERVRGKLASPASDLWSLGATLYAAVEGRGPFDRPGGSVMIMDGVINEDAPRAPSAGPLAPVIEALLRGDPATRPDSETAASLLADAASQAKTWPRPLASSWPDLAAGHACVAVADDATTDSRAIVGADAVAAGAVAAGAVAAGAVAAGAVAAGAVAAGAADARAADGDADIPPFMETPVFADLKMPDLDAPPELAGRADLPPSAELPAFMDAPRFADPPALPPDHAVPWSLANAAADWDPQDPLSLPDSHGQLAAPPAGQLAAPPAGQPAARSGARGRALAAAVAVVVFAVAGLVGWSAYSHSRTITTAQAQPPVQAPPGVSVPAHPARHPRSARHHARGKTTGQAAAAGTTITTKTHPTASGKATHSGPAKTHGTTTPSPGPAATSSGGTGPGTGGGTPPPLGYRWYQVTAASLGSTAGFKIAVPDAWTMSRSRMLTYFDAAVGSPYIEVDVTPFAYPNALREAEYQQAQAKADGLYPRYGLIAINSASFRGVPEATWRFHWYEHGVGRIGVLEVLFILTTSAGQQPYALTVSAPAAIFTTTRTVFGTALRTFEPLN